ncbi:MAG: hypothetical protein D6677_04700 [Calditrichaeota bacterium]|nr:MAG: hypothetical protein D6677_04700 [Calditrichota bacterium]
MRWIIPVLITGLLFGCNREKVERLEMEVVTLKKQNELIRQQTELKNRFVEEYTTTLNEVYDNLDHIRRREGLISEFSRDMEKGDKHLRAKMSHTINAIDAYIKASKNKLAALQKRYEKAEMESRAFTETIEKLTRQLEEKENHILALKTRNDSLSRAVRLAKAAINEKDAVIEAQSVRLNTAFYIIAPEEELQARHIVEEKGGLLGIGQTTVLSAGLADSLFTTALRDTLSRLTIPVNVNEVEIVSRHAPGSFELIPDGDSMTVLEIRDTAAFWRMRYLVVKTGS